MRRYFLQRGDGVVMASSVAAKIGVFDDLAVPLRLKDDFAVRNLAAFWAKQRELTHAELDLIEFLKEYYDFNE